MRRQNHDGCDEQWIRRLMDRWRYVVFLDPVLGRHHCRGGIYRQMDDGT